MSRTAEFDAWVGHFVEESLREESVERFVTSVNGVITEAIPDLAEDPVLFDDLVKSTTHQWLSFLAGLQRPEHTLELPAQASDLARSLARRGRDVKILLKIYLNAHHGVFAYLSQAADDLGGADLDSEDALRSLWKRADRWMDDSLEVLVESFFEERQRELDGSAARRAELVEALLAGEDLELSESSRELGHPIQAWQTAFLVWTTQVSSQTAGALRHAAGEVARTFDGAKLLTELVGSRDLRCWLATRERPSEQTVAQLRDLKLSDVSLAVGGSAAGVEGFRSSYADARAAQHLAMSSSSPPQFVNYRDVEVLCLSLGEPEALRRMVRREVAPLCAPGKSLAPVRETVLTYLANRMNVEATAEKLFVHGNTVRYRLSKAEELLGCQLSERPRQIELALQYVDYFGAPTGS